ncbi:MAG: primase C-terminal domain-containing protein [Chloroflexi bacterium]|nr:primase C-terminal domain-containing protein [Chloroflexota bacterium]
MPWRRPEGRRRLRRRSGIGHRGTHLDSRAGCAGSSARARAAGSSPRLPGHADDLQPPADENDLAHAHEINEAVVVQKYRREAARTGQRNNTLFRIACHLRDQGFSQDWTLHCLAQTHAEQPARSGATCERLDRRLREAERTIASAYRRPPRRERPKPTDDGSQPLDNSIREALLQRPDGAAFLRVYEGLRMLGVAPGSTFTRSGGAGTAEGDRRRLLAAQGAASEH